MRRLLRAVIPILLVLLIAGYFLYAYWPRERPAVPSGLPARLLASGGYGACLWIPYPHQNLGQLEGAIDDPSAYLAAAARVADLPAPVLRSFGPFAVPPSSEIVACADLDGDRFLLVARVYPGLAAVARLAGRLADNPWLRGGDVKETEGNREGVEEKVLHVAWRDGYWTVRAGDEPAPAAGAAPPRYPPSLAVFHLGEEVSSLPAGDYVLQRREEDLAVSLLGAPAPPAPPSFLQSADAPAMLVVAGTDWPADAERPLPPAAMMLFDTRGGLNLGPLGELPGLAVLNPVGGKRWGLPTKGLGGLLAQNLPSGTAGGWSVLALDEGSLARAKALAPEVSALVPPDDDGASSLILGLWLRPEPALRRVSQFRRGLERFPLADPRQVARWRDWETLLAPLGSCRQASAVAARSPSAFELRLRGCD